MNSIPLQVIAVAVVGFAVIMTAAGPASAIDGGAVAGRNRLSQATVGIVTLVAEDDEVGVSRCSGVLIAPDLVLTAAHCVEGDPFAAAVVLYNGAKPVRPLIRVVAINRYNVPSEDVPAQYEGLLALSLDTAVLRLASPVHGHQPIQVNHGGRQIPRGLRLAGAGLSNEGVGVLKTTRLDPLAMTATGLIVAATRGSEVCKGDSGGPVVAEGPGGPVVWGVASAVLSHQPPCGQVVVIAPATPNL